MSVRLVRGSVAASLALGCLGVLLALTLTSSAGCRRDDAQKLAAVQGLARDLSSAKLLRLRAGCSHLTAAQQELLLCDGLLQTLLHFAPAFPGSQVSAVGASTGSLFSRQARLVVHYEGRDGRGNLEALLQREANTWRIAALIPHP
jgi:hypothetical protein